MRKKILIAVFAILAALPMAASAATIKDFKDAKELWEAVRTNWDTNIKSYSSNIFSWGYRTQDFIKKFPEHFKKDPNDPGWAPPKPDWSYRVYGVKFKTPRKVLLSYDLSLHENTDDPRLIDRAIANMLRYAPGTAFNFGHRDEKYVYVVFPKITTKQLFDMPIKLIDRGAMKLLLIASYREVYWKTPDQMKDVRANMISDVIIGEIMRRFDYYFKVTDTSVVKKLDMSPRFAKGDYTLNEKTGWLTMNKSAMSKPKTVIRITFEDKNAKRHRGINKREAFVDPDEMMFVGMHEYENNKLVSVYQFSDLKINPGLTDADWDKYFKGRNISDKK